MAELARKNAAGPLCPAAFSSNLTVLLKRRLRSLLFPEEKKDTETGCAENCRRRTCRLTCLRHSALSAARTHLSRKSVAHIVERPPVLGAVRLPVPSTVALADGVKLLSVATRHCRARVRRAAPVRRALSRHSAAAGVASAAAAAAAREIVAVYEVKVHILSHRANAACRREAQHIVAAAQNFGQSVGVHRLHFALSLCLGSARELGVGARSAHRIRVRRFLELVKALDKVPLSVRIRPDSRNSRLARNHILLRIQRIEANLDLRRTCRDIVAVIPCLSNHDRGPARSVVNADRLGLRMRGTRTLIAEVVELSRVGTRKIGGVLLHKIARAVRKASIFAASLP